MLALKSYVDLLIRSDDGSYDKYDVENAIFSRLQRGGSKLDESKYQLVNKLRQKMWSTDENSMDSTKLDNLFILTH